jgi:hypothetical protein
MTRYPDNIREFVTQESLPLGESGYDVEVEIVRRSDLEVIKKKDQELVSIGLKQSSPLPSMTPDDLLVVFDLGTVLDIDDFRISDSDAGSRLPLKGKAKGKYKGPIRIPAVLTAAASISLLLSSGNRPLGTLTVDIEGDGRLADATFLPE